MNDVREQWEQRYRRGDTGWDRGAASPALADFLTRVEPCRVLIPGCGRGHEVVALAARGFRVSAVDIAPSAIASLQAALARRGLEARVIEADIFDFAPDKPFDAIYEQTCLCAIPPDRRKTYARRLAHWLKSGGMLYALFMQTGMEGGPPFHCDILQMRGLFPEPAWQWPEEAPDLVPHHHGRFELAFPLIRRENNA